MFHANEKGAVALLLAVIILSVIFVIATGIAVVRLIEMKLVFNISESMIAYQAADSGVECALYEIKGDNTGVSAMDNCDGISVGVGEVEIVAFCNGGGSPPCGSGVNEIKSIGSSPKIKRAIRMEL